MLQNVAYYSALVLETVAGTFGVRLYEEPAYQVVGHVGEDIEIRRYAPRLAAEVEYPKTGGRDGGDAFMLLFNYIAGANQGAPGVNKIAMTVPVEMRTSGKETDSEKTAKAEKIAMTAPVEMAESGSAGRIRFFLPASLTAETAPRPTDPRVKLVTVPGETVAVRRFSGVGWEMAERQWELVKRLRGTAWQPADEPFALYYDGPFTLPFLRRNEAAVAVSMRN
ncbi:SOUL family heme-binding protein [Blastochloris tepida]|uniref:SOUL heme-binding protein n=1 Tax=Blastochloris tepida TaxID=2233851 RepID=A0A348G5Q3_9HYPH|nr:heme-binding protein [Blastochloris tepida]BBF94886.1 SOUL heme-binding protein [Blastochloris tepida]